MCDRIIMPDGKEIESIIDDEACLCGIAQKEILTWIVQHIRELRFDEGIEIKRDVFGYFVSYNENLPEDASKKENNTMAGTPDKSHSPPEQTPAVLTTVLSKEPFVSTINHHKTFRR